MHACARYSLKVGISRCICSLKTDESVSCWFRLPQCLHVTLYRCKRAWRAVQSQWVVCVFSMRAFKAMPVLCNLILLA